MANNGERNSGFQGQLRAGINRFREAAQIKFGTPDVAIGKDHHEYQAQAERMAYAYAKELGMSRDEYYEYLPDKLIVPGSLLRKNALPIALLVQPPVPDLGLDVRKMLDILGIKTGLNVFQFGDWLGDKQGFKTPEEPYSAAMGVIPMDNYSGERMRRDFSGRRGAVLSDALAVALHCSEEIKDSRNPIVLLGSTTAYNPDGTTIHSMSNGATSVVIDRDKGSLCLRTNITGNEINWTHNEDRIWALVASRDIQRGKPQDQVGWITI